ncbi:MAG TPA: SpoIIE family protein phosphatase [Vicinamibacterales bacterium]|nr:SpoIIE family protein phosphatase [Vicinamibacterales bacterium]
MAKLRAFIVDDEPPARVRLRQLLAEADVTVVGDAGDAVEARAAIRDTSPDVVFLDIEMPETSGTELAASLTEPRPYIVFATAYDHYALAAFALDATDYLVKPITRARLAGTLARVRERLSRHSDLERDLVAASAVQALLLPQSLPLMRGYDSAALTVAARGVGGDFFVGQQIGPQRVVLALGDVSGKGMPAGLVASSLQARIETVARHVTGTAIDVVSDVNRTLVATSDTARYATLVYGDIDLASNLLTVVNAGHLPVIVAVPDAPTQLLASTGPALGILADAQFSSTRVPIAPGATIVIYSDGVTEATNTAGEEFGEDRLMALIAAHRDSGAEALCRRIIDAVRGHAHGAGAGDDITVLALKRAHPTHQDQ